MSKKIYLFIALLCFGSVGQAQGLIYVEGQLGESGEPEGYGDLFYVNVDGSGSPITATSPAKISPPQPEDGGVLFAIPNFGNPSEVLYFATQEDPQKMEIFLLDLNSPGTSTKINAELAANQEIEGGIATPDGTKVIYTVTTKIVPGSVETVDMYVVSIDNPGVATKVNPDLSDGSKVGEFQITPDSSRIVYGAQLNGTAEELFVTELSNLGVATKADGPPSGGDHVIENLRISQDGSRAFWIGGSGALGAIRNLWTVSLNDLGNDVQVNEALASGARITDYDLSGNGTTIVYRKKDSSFQLSDVFLVELAGGIPGAAAQVNPDWAAGGSGLAPSFEGVTLLESGTVALYNGPVDDPDVSELYETPLDALQTATRLNDALTSPAMGLPPQLLVFGVNTDESLVLYTQNLFDENAVSVVDRSSPGSAVLPVSPTQDQYPSGFPTFGPAGNLIAATLLNVDAEGDPVGSELHVADARVGGSNVRVSSVPDAGSIVLSSFWLPAGAPVVTVTDSDGDGVPDEDDAFPNDPSESVDTDGDGVGNNADTDDDNDGVADVNDDYPLGRFDDVPPDYWAFRFIETFARAGITAGCGPSIYCPKASVTRAQMAVFLERGIRGSDYTPPPATGNVFLDVGATDFAAGFIEQFYQDGITGGCGNSNYCPEGEVTRAQMAVFLLRAKYGAAYSPPPPSGVFEDVDLSYWAVSWIEQLAAEGITGGCGGNNYCPDNPVTRDQMAVFLVRTFGL